MVPLFQDYSFSNRSQAVEPIDFHYRLSDQGRIVLGQLSSQETVEFELLSRRHREGLMDLPSELRLLELVCEIYRLGRQGSLAPSELACLWRIRRASRSERFGDRRVSAITFHVVVPRNYILIRCYRDR